MTSTDASINDVKAPLPQEGAEAPQPSNTSWKNGLTHGVYAKAHAAEILTLDEDREEFDDHLRSLEDELSPDGPSEQATVVEIAQLRCLRRRLVLRYAQAKESQASAKPVFVGNYKERKEYLERVELALEGDPLVPNVPISQAQSEAIAAVIPRGAKTKDFENLCTDLERFLKLLAMIDTRTDKAMSRLIGYKEYKRQYSKEAKSMQKN